MWPALDGRFDDPRIGFLTQVVDVFGDGPSSPQEAQQRCLVGQDLAGKPVGQGFVHREQLTPKAVTKEDYGGECPKVAFSFVLIGLVTRYICWRDAASE